MEIIYKRIEELTPYTKNPRKNDKAVDSVANSISEFGFKVPIVIDKDGTIINGHTRYKASKKLGLKQVPCIIADDLTEEQIRAFRIADNKVSELAEWDLGLLDGELDNILNIDMSEFGFELNFDIDEGSKEEEKHNERERTANAYNLFDIDLNRCAGKYQMPILKNCYHIPKDLISFNYVMNTDAFDKGVHFYIDDYQFERVWNEPYKYIERLKQFDCVFTPDFSLYLEMPIAMQIWNVFRSRLVGQLMQDAGIKVIPTLQWCDKNSYDFCFDGLSEGGVVTVSTIGVKQNDHSNKLWFDGMDEAIKRLNPKHVVVYGGDIGYKFPCKTTYIGNTNTEKWSK